MASLTERAKTLNAATLRSIGITFDSEEDEASFVRFVSEKLEDRIGVKVSSQLNQAKLEEFEAITDSRQIKLWLEENVPNYKALTRNEIISFKRMLMRLSEEISASSKGRESFRSDSVESLDLSAQTYNCITRYGITAVGEIIDLLPSELHHACYLSSTCIEELRQKIEEKYHYQILPSD